MNIKAQIKSSIFYAILLSFLFFLLQGFTTAFVYLFTNKQNLSIFIGYLLTLFIISFKYKNELLNDLKRIKIDFHGNIIKVICVFIGSLLIVNISNLILYNFIGEIASNEQDLREIISSSPALMLISLGLIGPIVEELIFRFPYKNIKTNNKIKFIVYTLLFAFTHVLASLKYPDILFLIPYTFLSISIGYAFYKTNNIFASIFTHITNNLLTIILILILGG